MKLQILELMHVWFARTARLRKCSGDGQHMYAHTRSVAPTKAASEMPNGAARLNEAGAALPSIFFTAAQGPAQPTTMLRHMCALRKVCRRCPNLPYSLAVQPGRPYARTVTHAFGHDPAARFPKQRARTAKERDAIMQTYKALRVEHSAQRRSHRSFAPSAKPEDAHYYSYVASPTRRTGPDVRLPTCAQRSPCRILPVHSPCVTSGAVRCAGRPYTTAPTGQSPSRTY